MGAHRRRPHVAAGGRGFLDRQRRGDRQDPRPVLSRRLGHGGPLPAAAPARRVAHVRRGPRQRKYGATPRRLGDPRINGRRGHIYACPGGYQLYVVTPSTRAWTYAKKALDFAKVAQDGDEEGILLLDRLPTESEAEAIRHLRRRHETPRLSAERIESLGGLARSLAKTARAA